MNTVTTLLTKDQAMRMAKGEVYHSYFIEVEDFLEFGHVDNNAMLNWHMVDECRKEIKANASFFSRIKNLFV